MLKADMILEIKADIILEIIVDFNNSENTLIRTDANEEAIEEILEAWLSCQIGQGKDESKPNEKTQYKVKIGLDLSDDTFITTSDTGNKALTCGIIMDVFKNLHKIKISPLL